jgi:hypothetical protein
MARPARHAKPSQIRRLRNEFGYLGRSGSSGVARTSVFEVRGSYLVWSGTRAVGWWRVPSPFLSDRFLFVTVRLLQERRELSDADFRCLALAFHRAAEQEEGCGLRMMG